MVEVLSYHGNPYQYILGWMASSWRVNIFLCSITLDTISVIECTMCKWLLTKKKKREPPTFNQRNCFY